MPDPILNTNPAPEPVAAGTNSPVTPADPVVAPTPTWRDGLSDELKTEKTLENFKDVSGLAKSYMHILTKFGKDKMTVPDKSTTPEQFQELWNKLGRPESADKYELKLQEGTQIEDESFLTKFKDVGHKLGLNTTQMQGLFDMYNESQGEFETTSNASDAAQVAEGIKGLETKWGTEFKQNCHMANLVLKEYGHEGLDAHIKGSWGNDPQLIELLSTIGAAVLKEGDIKEGAISNLQGKSPEQAQSEINAIMGDNKHAFFDRDNIGHKEAVKQMEKLHQYLQTG